MLAARTAIRTSPGPGTGVSTSAVSTTSGPPVSRKMPAFIALLSSSPSPNLHGVAKCIRPR